MLSILSTYVNATVSTLQQAVGSAGGGSGSAANVTSAGLSFYQLLINSGHYNTLVRHGIEGGGGEAKEDKCVIPAPT